MESPDWHCRASRLSIRPLPRTTGWARYTGRTASSRTHKPQQHPIFLFRTEHHASETKVLAGILHLHPGPLVQDMGLAARPRGRGHVEIPAREDRRTREQDAAEPRLCHVLKMNPQPRPCPLARPGRSSLQHISNHVHPHPQSRLFHPMGSAQRRGRALARAEDRHTVLSPTARVRLATRRAEDSMLLANGYQPNGAEQPGFQERSLLPWETPRKRFGDVRPAERPAL
jgi:hypothetical protein